MFQGMDQDITRLSKKERRDLRRQERSEQQETSSHQRTFRRLILWGGSFVLLGLAVWGLYRLGQRIPQITPGELSVPVSASDHITGNPDSSTTLVEYADLQCPACGSYHNEILKKLVADEGTKFRFVFRYFPLRTIHKNADIAAQAAEAAGLQGKFWEMEDLLFERQNAWSDLSKAADTFAGYAKELGLDVGRFKIDIVSDSVKQKITTDENGGRAAGVNSTPTFYLNGKQIQNPQSYDAFKSLVTVQPTSS